jgi:hypothetical protein
MTLPSQEVILKAPEDYDVNKIGFVLIDEEFGAENSPKILVSPLQKFQCHICEKFFSKRRV